MAAIVMRVESNVERWQAALANVLPDYDIRLWPDVGNADEVRYALVWNPPAEMFNALRKLRGIFSVGAGIDHLSNDFALPVDVPVIRMVEDTLSVGMTEYVLFNVLRFHRFFDVYESQQRQREWRVLAQRSPSECRVGMLGFGVLGQAAAVPLVSLGFDVRAWSRTPKQHANVTCYSHAQLGEFIRDLDIVVCLLPLTDQTRGLIDANFLAQLPRGSCLINAARGAHVVESDVLQALDQEHLRAVALDVFNNEPLAEESELWQHPRVYITPHAAAITGPESAARAIAREVQRIESGKQPINKVNLELGY